MAEWFLAVVLQFLKKGWLKVSVNARPEHISVGRALFQAISLKLECCAEIISNVIERSWATGITCVLDPIRIHKHVI
jgi:hypothetical protein